MNNFLRLLVIWLCFQGTLFAGTQAFRWDQSQKISFPPGVQTKVNPGDWIIRNDYLTAVISQKTGVISVLWIDEGSQDWYADRLPVLLSPEKTKLMKGEILQDAQNRRAVLSLSLDSTDWPGLSLERSYVLQKGWKGLWVVSRFQNASDQEIVLSNFDPKAEGQTIKGVYVYEENRFGYAKGGLAYSWLEQDDLSIPGALIRISPRQSYACGRFIAIAESPVAAFGIAASLQGISGYIAGRMIDTNIQPVTTARYILHFDEGDLVAYPNSNGYIDFRIPLDTYDADIYDLGRESKWETAVVWPGDTYYFECVMDPPSWIKLNLTDSEGEPVACSIQVEGIGDTPDPDFSIFYPNCISANSMLLKGGEQTIRMTPGEYTVTIKTISKDYDLSPIHRTIKIGRNETVKLIQSFYMRNSK